MQNMIIGLVGRKASGKGTVAKILGERYGAAVYRYSDILRDILDLLSLEKSRENLVRLSEVIRDGFGDAILTKALVERMKKNDVPLVVLDGIRRVGELPMLRETNNFHLINVFSPLEVRFERMRSRVENAGETAQSFEDFSRTENASTEVTIADVEAQAERIIENSGTFEDLVAAVNKAMSQLGIRITS